MLKKTRFHLFDDLYKVIGLKHEWDWKDGSLIIRSITFTAEMGPVCSRIDVISRITIKSKWNKFQKKAYNDYIDLSKREKYIFWNDSFFFRNLILCNIVIFSLKYYGKKKKKKKYSMIFYDVKDPVLNLIHIFVVISFQFNLRPIIHLDES